MTENTKAILAGAEVSGATLEEVTEAVKFLARCHDVSVDGQAYLDSGGDDSLGAALSDSDIEWCRKRNPRLAAKEHKKRINNS